MVAFVWILLLSILWMCMTETFTLANLVIGFGIGYTILYASQHVLGVSGFIAKLPRFVAFVGHFTVELFRANFRVAHDVLTPTYYMRPGILAIPLDAETDLEITSLANLISLTPGTLSLDISTDRRVLYIYTMFTDDRESLVRDIKMSLEKPILELLR